MRREGLRTAAIALALVAAVLGAYARTAGHEFVLFDDDQYVYDEPHVRAGLTLEGLRWFLTHPHSINWHPLTSLSHMLDVELWGLAAGRHHVTSVLLHALASVLLFLGLRSASGATWPCAFVAALFALHPLRVESVAWVSERKDVLSGVFFGAALWAYAAYARRPSLARHLGVGLLFAAGLCCKPMLVTLPALFLLLDAWPLARWRSCDWRRLWLEKLPWLALSAAASAVTLAVQQGAGALRPFAALDGPTRLATALRGVSSYLWKTLWPTDLAFFYPHPALTDPGAWRPFGAPTLGALALCLTLSAAALALRRRAPWIAVGWLWFLGLLVPVCGLVQVGEQAWADRYAYLPTIGVYVALVFTLSAALRGRPRATRAASVAGLGLLLALGLATRAQSAVWSTSATLFEHALAVTQRNYMAANNLGLVRLEEGRAAEAEALFRAALSARPGDLKAAVNLGIALARRGRLEEAEAHLLEVLARHPREAQVESNLASVLASRGERGRAREHYQRALQLRPDLVGAHLNLGLLALQEGDALAAWSSFERALALDPEHAEARFQRARAAELLGRTAQAAADYRALLARAPDAAARARAAAPLAWILATAADAALRDGGQALALARSVESAGALEPWRAQALVAAACAEVGDFPAALLAQERAAALAPEAERADHRARLELYRAGQPLRVAPP